MAEMPTSKTIGQKYLDARKLQQGTILPQKLENDDDESGGGAGKRKQSSFKLEKLLGVLEKGRLKAQNFWRFLAQEGLDSNETKKTTLGKQKDQATQISDKIEKTLINKQSEERSKEVQKNKSTETSKKSKSDTSWQRAKAVEDTPKQRFDFQDPSPFSNSANSVAENTRRAIMGTQTPGSIIGARSNPLGFVKSTPTGSAEIGKSTAKTTKQSIFQSKAEMVTANAAETVSSNQPADSQVKCNRKDVVFN